eukprot:comp23103_c0_seq1/m.37151 comp23103_c0_seq1/g.37151  ORF comp23103_c0_seq1/g.37151 comp23103_c0_seq1/m.37151 type:complete len:182 (-) comp23103_c0_seq1:110-655(-)
MFASVLRPASGRLSSVCRCVHTEAFTATEGGAASTNSFASLFADTSFVRAGTHRGRHIKARVAQASQTSLKLDLGTKYPSFIPRPKSLNMPRRMGSNPPTVEVVVTLKATDFVQHIAGDTKPMSSHDGDVIYHRTVPIAQFARQNARRGTRLNHIYSQRPQANRGGAADSEGRVGGGVRLD